jgi:uncharacterized protein YdaU (DUF1376 family)
MSFAYMPIYTGDYLRDTRHLTPLRHGIYFLALMHCWDSKGPMPLDEQECAGICNCRSADEVEALRYIIDRYFIRMDDGHYNKRMADEVVRFEQISKARSDGGLRSAEARRDKARHGSRAKKEHKLNISSTHAVDEFNSSAAQVQDKSVSPSLSPSLSFKNTLPSADAEGGFVEFWNQWPTHPRKAAKKQCLAKWRSSGCAGIAGQVMASLKAANRSEDWTKDKGKFIPAPLVWLNQARWEAPTQADAPDPGSSAAEATARYLASQERAPPTQEQKQAAMAMLAKARECLTGVG